jgi:hypothetical protein
MINPNWDNPDWELFFVQLDFFYNIYILYLLYFNVYGSVSFCSVLVFLFISMIVKCLYYFLIGDGKHSL